jgi:hypothetical protein
VVRWFGANVSDPIARERLAAKETKHSGDLRKDAVPDRLLPLQRLNKLEEERRGHQQPGAGRELSWR